MLESDLSVLEVRGCPFCELQKSVFECLVFTGPKEYVSTYSTCVCICRYYVDG